MQASRHKRAQAKGYSGRRKNVYRERAVIKGGNTPIATEAKEAPV